MTQNLKASNKEKTATDLEVEKQLLPRLKFMGTLLLFFSLCALCASFFFSFPDFTASSIPSSEELATLPGLIDEDFPTAERFSMILVCFSFALVGSLCLFFVWKKKKQLGT